MGAQSNTGTAARGFDCRRLVNELSRELTKRRSVMKGHKAQFAWRTVHLALLPTNEDRAKAIVDWAGSQLTHQRVGRINVDLDE